MKQYSENNLKYVEEILLEKFPDANVKVEDMTGTLDHLEIFIASSAFQGLTLIKQHRLVMDALTEALKSRIHAVKLNTKAN